MKKLINYLLAIITLLTTGCGAVLSSFDSSVIMHTESEGKNSFNLKDIKGTTVAFLPFTQEGQIDVAYDDIGPELKSEVMAEVTDYVLARVSG